MDVSLALQILAELRYDLELASGNPALQQQILKKIQEIQQRLTSPRVSRMQITAADRTKAAMEITEAIRNDAVEYVYRNSWRVRMFVGRAAARKVIIGTIAQIVLAKCNAMRATANNVDAVQFESRQQLKDAVGFWPVVIQMLLSVIIKLIIDYFLAKTNKHQPYQQESD